MTQAVERIELLKKAHKGFTNAANEYKEACIKAGQIPSLWKDDSVIAAIEHKQEKVEAKIGKIAVEA